MYAEILLVVANYLNPSLSLRKVVEDKDGHQEIGQYGNVRVVVGYSRSIHGYYVKLSDLANGGESVLLTDRSDEGYLRFADKMEFVSALHPALDARGLYLEGSEEELAGVVANLTLQLMERLRNEEP